MPFMSNVSRLPQPMRHLVVSTELNVSPREFWAEQSLAAVNFELAPWFRMSAPKEWGGFLLKDWQGHGPPFKSWVLLFGFVPIDRHAFGTLEFSQDRGFVETSSSWVNRVWRHERTVKQTAGGCEVVDRLQYLPRLPVASFLLKAIYILVFRHRHNKLRARYGVQGG